MGKVNDYIKGRLHKTTNETTIDCLFNEHIIKIPERAHEFSHFREARQVRSYLKKTAQELKIRYPDTSLEEVFLACLNQDDLQPVFTQFEACRDAKKEELSIILQIFFYSLKAFDPSFSRDIRSDFIAVVIGLYSELIYLKDISHGKKFQPGRDKGSIGTAMVIILELVKKYPALDAKELQKKSDNDLVLKIALRTFANKVSIAREILSLPKPKKMPPK